MAKRELSAQAMKRRWKWRKISFQTLITIIGILAVLLAFIPIFLMLFLSLKNQSQFYSNLWAIPKPPQWSNYGTAWTQLIRNMINSVVTVSVGTALIVLLSAMSGYVFASCISHGKTFFS
jgi:ABC-type sugar transport system, permease component